MVNKELKSRKAKVIALSLGNGLSKLIGLAVGIAMVRILTKEDVAAYRQTFLAYAAIAPFLSMGIGQGMYYFLPAEKKRIRGRVLDGIAVLGFSAFLFSLFIAFGGNELLASRFKNPKVAGMLIWLIPYAFLTLPANASGSVFVATDHVKLQSLFAVTRQLFIGISTLIPLVLWETCEAAMLGNIAASMLMGVAAIHLMIRCTPKDSTSPSLRDSVELVKFTIPLAMGTMIGMVFIQLDKVIVSLLCSPDEFAIYSTGAFEIPLASMITGAIVSVTLADMRKATAVGNMNDALALFQLTAKKSCLVIFPAALFFMVASDSFIQLLFTKEYAASAIPFRWYLCLLPVRVIVFGSLIISLGRNDFILFRSVIALLINISLSVLFVWHFGAWGAVAATVLTVYCWVVPSSIYVISKEVGESFYEIIPIKDLASCFTHLVPVTAVAITITFFTESLVLEFCLISVCFIAFLLWYWNNRLYQSRQLVNFLTQISRRRRN